VDEAAHRSGVALKEADDTAEKQQQKSGFFSCTKEKGYRLR
jgi:hypothetical protein